MQYNFSFCRVKKKKTHMISAFWKKEQASFLIEEDCFIMTPYFWKVLTAFLSTRFQIWFLI